MCRHGRPELALPQVKWVTLLGIRKGNFPLHGTDQQCHSHLHWISLNRAAYLETGVELLPRGKRVHKNGLYVPVVTRFLGNGQVTPERKTLILPLDTIIPVYRPHCEHTGPHLSKACEVSVGNLTGSAWPSAVRWAVYDVCRRMMFAPLALREATGGKGEGPSDPLEELEDPERFLNRPPGERKLRSFLKGLCEATYTVGARGEVEVEVAH